MSEYYSEAEIIVVPAPPQLRIDVGQQGPPGPPGLPGSGGDTFERYATHTVSGHRAVIADGPSSVAYADSATLAHRNRYAGITLAAALAGVMVECQRVGEVVEPSWMWTAGLPIYIGATGVLTQTAPASPAVFSQIIGVALSTTSVFLAPREPITL